MLIVRRDTKAFLLFEVDKVNILFLYNGIGNTHLRGHSVDLLCIMESKEQEIRASTVYNSVAGSVREGNEHVFSDFDGFYAYLQNMTITGRPYALGDEYSKENRMKLIKRWFTRISKIDRLLGEQ